MEFKRDLSQIEISKGTKYWIGYLRKRIVENKNFLGCFIGQTGSGKSYSAISLQELLADGVIESDNIFMKSSDFIKRLVDGNLKPGTVLIWDEAGKDLNSKQWASKANKVINVVFQVFRRENIIVLFTLPYLSFLDSDARKLIHGIFETQGIDKNTKETKIKPLLVQTNQESGKMYKKYLRVIDNKELVPVKKIRLPLANTKLIKYYEDKKEKFSKDVYQEAYEQLLEVENKNNGKKQLTDRQIQVRDLLLEGLTQKEIGERLGIGQGQVSDHKTAIEKRGYSCKPLNKPIRAILPREKPKNEENH